MDRSNSSSLVVENREHQNSFVVDDNLPKPSVHATSTNSNTIPMSETALRSSSTSRPIMTSSPSANNTNNNTASNNGSSWTRKSHGVAESSSDELPHEIRTVNKVSTSVKNSGTSQDLARSTGKFVIKEGTPAAEALKANADVRVTRFDKVARRLHAQTMRRILKRNILLRPGSGDKRGKPPRIPEGARIDDGLSSDVTEQQLLDKLEEIDFEDDLSSLEDDKKPSKMYVMPGGGGLSMYPGLQDHVETDETIKGGNYAEKSLDEIKDDSDTATANITNKQQQQQQQQQQMDEDGKKHRDGSFEDSLYLDEETEVPSKIKNKRNNSSSSDTRRISMRRESSTRKMFLKKEDAQRVFHERKWKRKKKREEARQARKSYVKGKVINGVHELYTLSIAVMLGLRTSIGYSNGQLNRNDGKKRWLDIEDFMTVEKYEFSPKGGSKTPPHNLSHTFKFKDYSPLAFAYIRRMFGINEYEFLLSVCGNANFIEFTSNAKSGQFFFYSSDGKYMIKTMTNAESKFLRRILPHYFRYCSQNPNTLITKFLGMYRVKLYHLRRNVKFIIMNSVFDTDKYLQSFYDLKGSIIGRDAPCQDVKKDNDVRRELPDNSFALAPELQDRVRKQVKKDCEFLKEMKIMDYSMLIGVHHIPQKASSRSLLTANHPMIGTSFREQGTVKYQKEVTAIRDLLSKKENINLYHSQKFTNNGETTPIDKKENSLPDLKKKAADAAAKDVKLNGESFINHEDKVEPNGDMSIESCSTIDHYFDEDDEYSYLEISSRKLIPPNESELIQNDVRDEDIKNIKRMYELELKKEDATEQIYWPFQRFYEIQGRRRMNPIPSLDHTPEKKENNLESTITYSEEKDNNCLLKCLDGKVAYKADIQSSRARWPLVNFEKPLSNRKDSGLVMETEGVDLPLMIMHGKKMQSYDGKIFYMGIIDVLQQFNIRKRIEARWRRLSGGGWEGASCVHPDLYAERFLRFFDEYTQSRRVVDNEKKETKCPEEDIGEQTAEVSS